MTFSEQLIESELNQCVHFRGVQNGFCSAGVNYLYKFDGETPGMFCRMPCHKVSALHKPEFVIIECEFMRFPTLEEATAKATETETAFDAHMSAMSAAKEHAKANGFKKGNGGRGQIDCPLCKGILHYSVASVNGHMHGRCSTKGCVSWME